MLRQLQSIYI